MAVGRGRPVANVLQDGSCGPKLQCVVENRLTGAPLIDGIHAQVHVPSPRGSCVYRLGGPWWNLEGFGLLVACLSPQLVAGRESICSFWPLQSVNMDKSSASTFPPGCSSRRGIALNATSSHKSPLTKQASATSGCPLEPRRPWLLRRWRRFPSTTPWFVI